MALLGKYSRKEYNYMEIWVPIGTGPGVLQEADEGIPIE